MDEFIKENGGDLPLGNVRVIVEALKHFENAKNIIDTCALNGVQSIHLSPVSFTPKFSNDIDRSLA